MVLTGASGFVGSHMLDRRLATPEVTGVTYLTRRKLSIEHLSLSTVKMNDFTQYDRQPGGEAGGPLGLPLDVGRQGLRTADPQAISIRLWAPFR